MRLRGVASSVFIFSFGVLIGMLLLRHSLVGTVGQTEAQRRALQILDQPPAVLSIGDNRIVAAVKRIEPAVVNIDTVSAGGIRDDTGMPLYVDPNQEIRGKGSGVILTPDGYIITCNHVIEGANRIRVTLADGHWYYAHLIGGDEQSDIAVIRIDVPNLPAATLGDSDRLQVGEWAIAMGNPLGLGSTITVGVISALNRRNLQIDDTHRLDGAIQTDAAINRGNSGGALANINGQIIGINTAILSPGPSGGSIGLGFAIPINTVRRVARDLIAHGTTASTTVRLPWLGIEYDPIQQDQAQELNLRADSGVLVDHVLPESPAALAGVMDGDILLAIDGAAIHSVIDVREIIRQHKVGDGVILRILRPGELHERHIRVTLRGRPDNLTLPPHP